MATPGSQAHAEASYFHQNVIVMRHGDRLDNVEPMWLKTAARKWDPPLANEGFIRSFSAGRRFRDLGYPISRIVVSPFLRCVQTTCQVISGLCAVEDDLLTVSARGGTIDPSNIKVSIEFGLCEMLNNVAIRKGLAPEDGNFDFKLAELEPLFPAGTVDPNYQRIYREMPRWGEAPEDARRRYQQTITLLSERYPTETLLLVTHGEAVGVAVRAFMDDIEVVEVEYCAYAEMGRQVLPIRQPLKVTNHPMKTGIHLVKLG